MTYQADTLIRELQKLHPKEYLAQACKIRDVFLVIAEYVRDELQSLDASDDPDFARARALGRVLHEVFAYTRYLWASSPAQSPPGIQVALAQLTDLYFPKEENGEPVCLVRPQWKYNLTYVQLGPLLRRLIKPSEFDPDGKLGVFDPQEILDKLWARRPGLEDPQPPRQLAILSFAGLDTQDTLLYPLLAHELGHFIDYSFKTPLHLETNAAITAEQVRGVLEKADKTPPDPNKVNEHLTALVLRTFVALREILADLLATRMLGFGYFVAQVQFLKSLSVWPQPTITPSGYPGIQFRLSIVFNHLVSDADPRNVRKFFRDSRASGLEFASQLCEYLDHWHDRLKPKAPTTAAATPGSLQTELNRLAENAVRAALPDLEELARRAIPDERSICLKRTFFERITRLQQDLPPVLQADTPDCFGEIMSAAWAYQLLHGEAREAQEGKPASKLEEHRKTCRLVLKAVELIPTAQSAQPIGTASVCGGFPASDRSGVLTAQHIRHRLSLAPTNEKYLGIVPLLPKSVQTASLDVHLGSWFVVARRMRLNVVKLGDPVDEQLLLSVGRERIFVPRKGSFVIHPGDFVLGATLEFVALPADVVGFVEGKSGLGRRGLIVATATQVAPGFHGVIVLEMANTGTVPLEVTPEMAIAQLVLQVMTEAVPRDDLYHGPYYCQIQP
jgi:dCTP deaminase